MLNFRRNYGNIVGFNIYIDSVAGRVFAIIEFFFKIHNSTVSRVQFSDKFT